MQTVWQRCGFFAIYIPMWLAISAFGQQAESGQSLGEVARKLRKDTTDEVKMTDADTKKLFESVDRIFAFAAEDTGMPKHAAVQGRLGRKAEWGTDGERRIHQEVCATRVEHEEARLPAAGFQSKRISGEVHRSGDCGLLR